MNDAFEMDETLDKQSAAPKNQEAKDTVDPEADALADEMKQAIMQKLPQ